MSRHLLFGGSDSPGAPRIGTARPKSFDAQVQDIASAAHSRGVTLLRGETIVGSVEAADLCRTIRAAHEQSRGDDHRRRHVEQMVGAISLKLRSRGPVEVSRAVWGLLSGYARPKKNGGGK